MNTDMDQAQAPQESVSVPEPAGYTIDTDIPSATLTQTEETVEIQIEEEVFVMEKTVEVTETNDLNEMKGAEKTAAVMHQDTDAVEIKTHSHVEVTDVLPEELEALLLTNPKKGLSSAESAERLITFGRNEIIEKKPNMLLKFLSYFNGSISYLLIITAGLSGGLQSWIDFGIIVALLIANAVIGFAEEAKAESALNALKQTLALKSRLWRDGKLVELPSAELVPGDIVVLRLGEIIPADARLLGIGVTGEETEGDLQIDQSALTGESLPVHKKKGDTVYASSVVKQGQMLAVVTKTGIQTFIGRAANLMAITVERGHFQKIIGQIGNFLVLMTLLMVGIIFTVKMIKSGGRGVEKILLEVLVLTVAAIPVGLPTVLSVTMAVGAKQLAKKKVIVKRLTAVEEMASVSILCSDKTGTLTMNELSFDEPYLCPGFTTEDILLYSYQAAEPGTNDPIESAVRNAAKETLPALQNLPREEEHEVPGYKMVSFMPFNPTTKMTQATIINKETKETFKVAKGAPQVIIHLVGRDDDATRAVNALARRGLRALGVARTVPGNLDQWELVGMISLLDPPRPDSAETIRLCEEMGVSVKMITGDQQIIGKEVAHRLGMDRCILNAEQLVDPNVTEDEIVRRCVRSDGFAQVIPEHKYRVVELLQERGYIVGMTGDGVNDAPALKKANVGIAVHGCTDAARSASDIVLLAPGLGTIVDGILVSRAIFQRMRSYALYRITSTIHFLLFFFIIILTKEWILPAKQLIMICLLNDAATLVIAVDNAQISEKPDKWRLGQLITLSFILGILLSGLSFAHFFIFQNMSGVTEEQLKTIMYLHISSAPHFVIFSTRLSGFFWENLPSPIFFTAVMGTQVFAMFISIYGLPGGIVAPIGWGMGVSILAVSLLFFVVLDVVKVMVLRYWSFELTVWMWPSPARRRKLAERRTRQLLETRYRESVEKVRKVVKICSVLAALRANRLSEKIADAKPES